MRPITVIYAASPATGQVASGTPIPLNMNNANFGVGFICIVTGTVNYTVNHTYDNVLDPNITPTWEPHGTANMVNATTTQESNFVIPVAALQVVINSGTGSVKTVVTQQGI